MRGVLLYFMVVITVFITTRPVYGAFMVEAHSSGLANTNFQARSEPRTSIPSQALGVTAVNSVYGGVGEVPDTYT